MKPEFLFISKPTIKRIMNDKIACESNTELKPGKIPVIVWKSEKVQEMLIKRLDQPRYRDWETDRKSVV